MLLLAPPFCCYDSNMFTVISGKRVSTFRAGRWRSKDEGTVYLLGISRPVVISRETLYGFMAIVKKFFELGWSNLDIFSGA